MKPALPISMFMGALMCACQASRAPALGGGDALTGPLDETYAVPDWDDRDYLLHLPPGYDGSAATPVVVAFHGGGGKKEGVNRSTCRDGDEGADNCLFAVADREGFIVVAPDGVDARGLKGRSWNAGGGEDGWRCVGGVACESGSDDVAYTDDLLAELARALRVDADRVYATGISNGAAMSHRLACERSEVFAAIAPVAGANQALGWPGCAPSRPVPVLHLHGTEDPCWGYDGAIEEDLCADAGDGPFMDVETSMDFWREQNGCAEAVETARADQADDGTEVVDVVGQGCAADTTLVRIEGGGHTWPDGWQYLREKRIGRVSAEVSGSDEIWAFFQAHDLTSPSSARPAPP